MNGHALLARMMISGVLACSVSMAQTTVPSSLESDRPPANIADNAASSPAQLGLVMPTPYVRGKIPVVFIHGLWMNTSSWSTMIAELRADRSFDDQFQFWTFGYATGDPIPFAAYLFRQSLDEARQKHDPARNDPAFDRMILVGHSMGGLLAKMMVVESGDRLWRVISPRRTEEIQGDQSDVKPLLQATSFAPRAEVRRVIFIATPHRGSQLDSGSINQLGNRLVRVSDFPLGMHRRLVSGNKPGFFRQYFADGMPSSVEELKANGPFLSALFELPIAPNIQAHSIIAVKHGAPPGMATDGFVTFESARLPGVASEKVVTCPHLLCLKDSEVIGEVRRILQESSTAR